MEDSNHGLIKAIGMGDHLAFECLVRRYQSLVLNFIYRYMEERRTAEDLTQEVFLRVFRASSEFEPRGKVLTWILKIAYNLCLNEMKRLKRCKRLQDNLCALDVWSEPSVPPDVVTSYEHEKDIMTALRRLPENQRAALLLRANEGLSYSEIASVLSVSVSSVQSLIFRARTGLRQALKIDRED